MPANRPTSSIFTLGAEARLSPASSKFVDGTATQIPSFWFVVISFAGVVDGVFSMRSALSGVEVGGAADFDEVDRAMGRALRHYPVDGKDIEVASGRALSRIDPLANRLRSWRLWVPAAAVLGAVGAPDPEAEGRVVGWGIGIEKGGRDWYLSPYLAVQIQEEQEDGRILPLTVPARTVAPFDRGGKITPEVRLATAVPALFQALQEMGKIGSRASVYLRATPQPHYSLGRVYANTSMAAAFAAAERGHAQE